VEKGNDLDCAATGWCAAMCVLCLCVLQSTMLAICGCVIDVISELILCFFVALIRTIKSFALLRRLPSPNERTHKFGSNEWKSYRK